MSCMSRLALAGIGTVVAAIAYAVLGVLWWLRDRSDRAVAARLPALGIDIDHFHAAATAGWPDPDEIAAAVLLLDGRLSIDPDGLLSVTDGGGDDLGHEMVSALWCAVRSQGPVMLSVLSPSWAGELPERRNAFLREQDARVPGWSARKQDRIGVVAMLLALLLSFFYTFVLVFGGGMDGDPGVGLVLFSGFLCVIWGLMLAVPLVYGVMRVWPNRRDPYRDYCAALPPHPALAALDEEQRARLNKSFRYREPVLWESSDSGGPD